MAVLRAIWVKMTKIYSTGMGERMGMGERERERRDQRGREKAERQVTIRETAWGHK